jgi:DNA repair photolyase
MYDLNPPRVFVHKRVYENPQAVVRLERMLEGLGNPPFDEVDEADTPEVIAASGALDEVEVRSSRVRQGVQKVGTDPIFLFNTYVWDPDKIGTPAQKYDHPRASALARFMAGVGPGAIYGRREPSDGSEANRPFVCQGGWSFHTINGCVHKCDYCGMGCGVNFMLDLEEVGKDLERNFRERPHQRLYRYDLSSDYPAFEPEYGASELFGELFERNDMYFLVYTKSDNIDHLLDLPYKSHTICYWTVATETQCTVIERDTPSLDERLEAMRKCQEAGYVVRAGFSPIIPHKNWREEATVALEKLFAAAKPDTVRLWVVSMMLCDEAEDIFGADNLDPKFLATMRVAAPELDEHRSGPFPRAVRAEIYAHYLDEIRRISPETPVNLCSEERELWDMLADKLVMSPDDMYCCCGQTSIPPRTESREPTR